MPISPNAGESKDEFISRCMSVEVGAGKDQDQAYAICESKWNESFNDAPVSVNFKRKVLVDEDFNEEVVEKYLKKGFEVHVRSKRKIKKKDKKTYNKLKKVRLSEDNLRFGDVKQLNDKYNYDEINISGDIVLDKLMVMGREIPGKTIKSVPVESMEHAIQLSNNLVKDVDMKFITVRTYFRYGLKPNVPTAKSGSRDFCSKMMVTPNKLYTLEEIQSLSTSHLTDMGLPADVFLYKGGFYHNPDTGVTTPDCRHTWYAEVKIEP